MASEAGMDCELCEKGLLDLLYGELEDGTAQQMRAHLEGCSACRQAFERLESGRTFARKLEIVAAPAMDKVLAAAREKAAANRAAREQSAHVEEAPPREVREPEADGFGSWLRWLGALVMGPQLGVATVLMLVVGIGLWYLPQLGGGAGRATVPLLEPEPAPVAETSALEPAEPLQLTHDPRTGRVMVEEQTQEDTNETEVARAERPARPQPPPTVAVDPDQDDQAQQALAALERQVAVEEASEVPGQVETDSLPEMGTSAGSFEGGPLPPSSAVAPATQPVPQPSVRPSMPAFDLDSVPGGPQADDLGAAALHGQARQLAAAGRCQDSVARYQQLQSRYPTYPETGRASMEMADCLRRLGRTRDARVALERASRSPVGSVSSAARRALLEMDTADRAAEATTAPAEAAATQ